MGHMKGRRRVREEAVTEYLAGDVSCRELAGRYGISSSTLSRWVEEHRSGKKTVTVAEKEAIERVAETLVTGRTEMPGEVGRLQKELHEARLYNKLLEAMIDIAEDQMGVQIRKKRGARQ